MTSADTALPRVLIVDDNPAKLALIRRVLTMSGAELIGVGDAASALALSRDREYALFILDVNMPGMDGFELAQRFADQPETRGTPMMFITGSDSYDGQNLRGYDIGAVDYLVDPVNPFVLRSKVRVFLDLYRGKLRLKKEIAERERQAELAQHRATHDPLTGLPNRLLFWERLTAATVSSRRRGSCALLYLDVDGFKGVNDTHGHQVGDELLREIAQRLRGAVRGEDLVARLGGDEFAVLLEPDQDAQSAAASSDKFVELLSRPFRIDGAKGEVRVGASVGAALYPGHALTPDALLSAADEAMYRAKKAGKNRWSLAG